VEKPPKMYSPLPSWVLGQGQQTVLDLGGLRRDRRVALAGNGTIVGLQREIAQGLQLGLHLRQGAILGAEPGLCAVGVGIVLLTLRERLIVVVDAAGRDRILRRGGEREI